MSSPAHVQNGQPGVWSTIAPYIAPPLAASIAIIPVFYGFVAKSAQQLGKPIPTLTIKEAIKGGFKAAPSIGVTVGTQMIAQNTFEKALMMFSGNESKPNFASMLFSAMMVGVISAPPLAVFNGQTMGKTVMSSIKNLSAKQVTAIVTRETSFLFSLRISEPVSEAMKQISGDNKGTEIGSAFISGAIGSTIGHPADTAFTLWQKEMEVVNFRQLFRGAPVKAVTVGCFAIIYKIAKEAIESRS